MTQTFCLRLRDIPRKSACSENLVKFEGFIVDQEGTRPDPVKAKAIRKFQVLKDLTNLKLFVGFANQLGKFCPDLKHLLEPLKPFLSGKNAYAWNDKLQETFFKAKDVLC